MFDNAFLLQLQMIRQKETGSRKNHIKELLTFATEEKMEQ